MFENAQQRATRLVPDLRGLSYKERLEKLILSTLEYRRKRLDLIQVFKIIHGLGDIDMNLFFTFTENNQLRGHNLTINKPRANKSDWDSLTDEIVNSKTVLEFKTKLDKLWKLRRYDMTEIY